MIPAPATQKLTTYMRLWTTRTQAQQNRLRKNNKFKKKWGGGIPLPFPYPSRARDCNKYRQKQDAVRVGRSMQCIPVRNADRRSI